MNITVLYFSYLSSCDKIKKKIVCFLTFLFLLIFFRLRLYVKIVMYIMELALGVTS